MNLIPKKPRFFNFELFKSSNKEKDQLELIKNSLKYYLDGDFRIDDRDIEEAIELIDQAGKNQELYNLIKSTIKSEFLLKIKEILKIEDFLLVYNFFQNFEIVKFLCEDVFSIFEQNFLVFMDFNIRDFFNKIINEILKEENYISEQIISIIINKYRDIYYNTKEGKIDKDFEKLKKFLQILNYLNIENLIIEKYRLDHLEKEYNPKLETIKKLDLCNFLIEFDNLKKKELILIKNIFLKSFHDNLITNFYKVIYNINIENFLALIHLYIKENRIVEIQNILSIFKRTEKIQKLIDLLSSDFKKLIIKCESIENLIKTIYQQVKNCELFFENFKQVERKILYNIENTLNYEKYIDPQLVAKAFHYKLISNEKFDKNNFKELIVMIKLLVKTDVIFAELYKIFLESFFLGNFNENYFFLIEILENEFGKDKFEKFRNCIQEIKDSDKKFKNLNKSVLDVKVLNEKLWPFKKDNEINFDVLSSDFKNLYLDKKLNFNSSNGLLELNFLKKFNICEIDYNYSNDLVFKIKCDLMGAIIFLSFKNKKEICLKFISSINMIPIEVLKNKILELNKKYKVFFLNKNNLKINFSKLAERNLSNLDFLNKKKNLKNLKDLKIESVELKNKPKEEILKQKKKVVKSIITRTIKLKGSCFINEVIEVLKKNLSIKGLVKDDLNKFIEALIDSDIIERDSQNFENLKYVD